MEQNDQLFCVIFDLISLLYFNITSSMWKQ